MTLKQTDYAYGRKQQAVGYAHGTVCAAVFEFEFTEDFTAASDVIELGFLPGGAQVIGATLIGEGMGATTADVGLMDGKAGEDDDSRALTADLLFDGVSVNNNEADADRLTCLGIAKADDHRGLGATVAADISAGSAKLTVVVEYIF